MTGRLDPGKMDRGKFDRGAGQPVTCEGYGPGGVAVLVEARTTDRQRTVAAIRRAFTDFGGSPGADGAVAYLFNSVGQIRFAPGADLGRIMAVAFECGAEDVVTNPDGTLDVLTAPADLATVCEGLKAAGLAPEVAVLTRRAALAVRLAGQEAHSMQDFLATMRHLKDVVQVYSNAEFADGAH